MKRQVAGKRATRISSTTGAGQMANCAALFIALALILTLAGQLPSEARYLPTRADEASVEALKEIIKNLLNEASEAHDERAHGLHQARRALHPDRLHQAMLMRARSQQYPLDDRPSLFTGYEAAGTDSDLEFDPPNQRNSLQQRSMMPPEQASNVDPIAVGSKRAIQGMTRPEALDSR